MPSGPAAKGESHGTKAQTEPVAQRSVRESCLHCRVPGRHPGSPGGQPSQVSISGTGAPITGDAPAAGTGDATQVEFAGQTDGEAAADAYPGIINDQSRSTSPGNGVSVTSGQKAKSTPQFNTGFEGLNYQQRYARSGNQFSIEPRTRHCASATVTKWKRSTTS
ncbi:MAG TPA: hypothetical protein VFU36_14405 [Jatrophihabitans sp.]|nr:hypothetical protein [Jatrophihabitans sp.]